MNRFKLSLTPLIALIALVVLVFATSAGASTPSVFKLTTKGGRKGSFSFVGYEFLTSGGAPVSKPSAHKKGQIDVDLKIASNSEKSLLANGPLKAASLHISALLPKPQNLTYTFSSAKITQAVYAKGSLGEVGTITLSYKRVTT